jgi:hypothetical protein
MKKQQSSLVEELSRRFVEDMQQMGEKYVMLPGGHIRLRNRSDVDRLRVELESEGGCDVGTN